MALFPPGTKVNVKKGAVGVYYTIDFASEDRALMLNTVKAEEDFSGIVFEVIHKWHLRNPADTTGVVDTKNGKLYLMPDGVAEQFVTKDGLIL